MDQTKNGELALAGLTVLELGEYVAAPYCGKLLADYGATVIKIEPPAGDPSRMIGPFPTETPDPERSALYLYLNSNKQSVVVDIDDAVGQETVRQLAAGADILIENYLPGHLEQRALGYERLHEINPRLVYVSLTAFGQSGPWSRWQAPNLVALGAGGQMHLTGDADREPLKAGGEQADYQLGLNGFGAALTGIWDALDTGAGQHIDIAAQEVMASTLEVSLNVYAYLGLDYGTVRRGNVASATIGLYPCEDGFLGVHAMARNFRPLVETMGMPELADDERFSTPAARLANGDELLAIMYGWAAAQHKREAYARAGAMRGPITFVHDMADLLNSPQLAARNYLQEVEHPVAGRVTYPGAPFQMSESPARTGRAPLLGEHTSAVLHNLPASQHGNAAGQSRPEHDRAEV